MLRAQITSRFFCKFLPKPSNFNEADLFTSIHILSNVKLTTERNKTVYFFCFFFFHKRLLKQTHRDLSENCILILLVLFPPKYGVLTVLRSLNSTTGNNTVSVTNLCVLNIILSTRLMLMLVDTTSHFCLSL